jgi:hypothetical protein
MPGSAEPDRHAYERIFNAFYQGFFDAGAQLAVVHPAQPFERFPVLVVPALYIATTNTAISPSRSAWSQPTASPCRREHAPPPGPTAWR